VRQYLKNIWKDIFQVFFFILFNIKKIYPNIFFGVKENPF
jgi:hypothetical protein